MTACVAGKPLCNGGWRIVTSLMTACVAGKPLCNGMWGIVTSLMTVCVAGKALCNQGRVHDEECQICLSEGGCMDFWWRG